MQHETYFRDNREQFPALARTQDGSPVVYLDGPAGSQVPRGVIGAVADYLMNTNANHDGFFATCIDSDAMLDEAHRAMADFVGTDDPDLVSFGANMTTLTFALSRAIGQTWKPGDEVIVTSLDHDANVTPWVLAARDAGATVHRCAMHHEDCTLDLDDLKSKLSERTRLVAVCCASNAVGTVTPVAEISGLVHDAGAELFLDAVHYAPHRAIDVTAWDCDYLACSAYKFFGPHVGILYGKREHLESLPAYKLRPASDELPGRWMTGTQSHEGIAGTLAAVEYLGSIGRDLDSAVESRRAALLAAFTAIEQYETKLAERLLAGLGEISGLTIYGITDPAQLSDRVPTVSITLENRMPDAIAQHLADRGIFVWSGNYYALPWTESLGLEPEGAVRIGLLHYNTPDEVDRLLATLRELA